MATKSRLLSNFQTMLAIIQKIAQSNTESRIDSLFFSSQYFSPRRRAHPLNRRRDAAIRRRQHGFSTTPSSRVGSSSFNWYQ